MLCIVSVLMCDACMFVCMYALRIVSMDMILCLINILIIFNLLNNMVLHFLLLQLSFVFPLLHKFSWCVNNMTLHFFFFQQCRGNYRINKCWCKQLSHQQATQPSASNSAISKQLSLPIVLQGLPDMMPPPPPPPPHTHTHTLPLVINCQSSSFLLSQNGNTQTNPHKITSDPRSSECRFVLLLACVCHVFTFGEFRAPLGHNALGSKKSKEPSHCVPITVSHYCCVWFQQGWDRHTMGQVHI